MAAATLLAVPALAGATRSTRSTKRAVHARAALYLSGEFSVAHTPVTISGRAVELTGVVRPYVRGQKVELRAFVSGHRFAHVTLRLKASRHHAYGGFTWQLRSPTAGTVSIVVDHAATPKLAGFERRTSFAALDTNVGFGATGRFVELIQQRLAALHFYIPQTGVYDTNTGLAVDAYHRLLGQGVSQLLSPGIIDDLLNGIGTFQIRFPNQGNHAEGDLTHQLLALTNGSKVYWILPISSGKPSTPTVLGSWQIYSRVPGYLPDGMYYSDFFIRGYAIHGYNPAPDYPASHGCMRLPIIDAIPVFSWLTIGDWVDTYYR